MPDAFLLPVAQTPPTGHARAAAQLFRQHLPRNSAPQYEEDAGQTSPVRSARSATFGSVLWSWKKRFNQIPQDSGKKSTSHESSVRVTGMFQATTSLLSHKCLYL